MEGDAVDDHDPQHAKPGAWVSVDAVAHERELRVLEVTRVWDAVHNLTKIMDVQRVAQEKALLLQAQEYERRLEVLNHAHSQAEEARRETVPRETFDLFRAESQKDRAAIHLALAKAEGAAEQDRIARQRQTTNLTIGLTILSITIGVLMRFIGP